MQQSQIMEDKVISAVKEFASSVGWVAVLRNPTFPYNSNSWAQSVIEYAGGKVVENVNGADISSDKRIPKTYFDALCPIRRRPKIN